MAQNDRTTGLVGHTGIKAPARTATTANIVLAGEQTIDGVACVTGDRVLVKDQTSGVDNGIYVVDTGNWSRSKDFNGAYDIVRGTVFLVLDGTVNQGFWQVSTNDPITIGTTSLAFLRSLENNAANIDFLQSGSGMIADDLQNRGRQVLYLTDAMSVAQRAAWAAGAEVDITAQLQSAIDSLGDSSPTGRAGVDILISGPGILSGTITSRRRGIRLVGNGWGYRRDTGARRSYLRWNGIAGIPMLKFIDCYIGPAGVSRLKLMGNTAAKPSSAIEFNEDTANIPNQNIHLEDVYLGGFSGETDVGAQFTRGIEWTGDPENNSEHLFENVYVTGCSGAGIYQSAVQNVNLRLDHVVLYYNGVGLNICGAVQGSNVVFLGNTIDILQPFQDDSASPTNAHIEINGYYSELAGRMADLAGVGRLSLTGQFQISSSLNADGKIVKQDGISIAYSLRLQDFRFTQGTAPAGSPHIAMRCSAGGSTQRSIILDNVSGWALLTGGTNGLDVAPRLPLDRTYVYFRENQQSASPVPALVAENFLQGNQFGQVLATFDAHRRESRNDTSLRLMDDFLGDVLADQWNGQVGSDPQCIAPTVLLAGAAADKFGGVVRLTTGDDAGATMALNGSQLDSGLNWGSWFAGLCCEFRIRLSAITNVAVFIGFTDQVAALEMPFTLAAGNALTSDAANATGVLFDTAADTDEWCLVGVAANVDATKQFSGSAPVAATYENWRIEFSATGSTNASAYFYRNGVLVGTVMANAIVGNTDLTPVVAAFSRGAASRNIDVDYVFVQCNRF